MSVARYFMGKPIEELPREQLLEAVDFLWDEAQRERRLHQQTLDLMSAYSRIVSGQLDANTPDRVLKSLEITDHGMQRQERQA